MNRRLLSLIILVFVLLTAANTFPAQAIQRDQDGDGITDDQDACPQLPGVPQFAGCPDTDGDGIDDRNDQCPAQPGPAQYGGCPPPDSDGDGLDDTVDQCPSQSGPRELGGCPPTAPPPPPDSDGDGFPDGDDRCPNEPGIPGVGRGDCGDQDGDFITNDGDVCPNEPGPAENGGCPPPTATPLPTLTPTPVIVPYSNTVQPPISQPGNVPGSVAENLLKDCALRNESAEALLLYNSPIFETSPWVDEPFQPYYQAQVVGTLAPGDEADISQVFWYPIWPPLGNDALGSVWLETSGGWLWYNSWDVNSYDSSAVPFFPDLQYPLVETAHLWDLISLNCHIQFRSTNFDCVVTNYNAAPAPFTNYIGTEVDDVQVESGNLPQNGLLLASDLIRYHYDPGHFSETFMMWAQLHGGSRIWLSETVAAGQPFSEVSQTFPNATALLEFPCFVNGVDHEGYIIYSQGPNDGFFPLVQVPLLVPDPDDVAVMPTPTPLPEASNEPPRYNNTLFTLPDGLLLRLGDGSVRPIIIGDQPGGLPQILDPEDFLPAVQSGEFEQDEIPLSDLFDESEPPSFVPVPQQDPNVRFFLFGQQNLVFLLGIQVGDCREPTNALFDLNGDGLLDFCGDLDGDGDTDADDLELFFPADGALPNLLLPYDPPPEFGPESLPGWLLPAVSDPEGIGLLLPAVQSARETGQRVQYGLLLPAVLPFFNPSPDGEPDQQSNLPSVFALMMGDGSVMPVDLNALGDGSVAPNPQGILIGLNLSSLAACDGSVRPIGNLFIMGDGSVRSCDGSVAPNPQEGGGNVQVLYLQQDDEVLVSFENGDIQQFEGPGAVVIMPDGQGGSMVGILIGL